MSSHTCFLGRWCHIFLTSWKIYINNKNKKDLGQWIKFCKNWRMKLKDIFTPSLNIHSQSISQKLALRGVTRKYAESERRKSFNFWKRMGREKKSFQWKMGVQVKKKLFNSARCNECSSCCCCSCCWRKKRWLN